MKRNKGLLLLTLLSAVVQKYCFQFMNHEAYQYAFASGILRDEMSEGIRYLEILYLCLPIIFLLYYFNGRYADYVEGYGRLIIVRNGSRKKLVLKSCSWIAVEFLGYVVLFTGIYQFHNNWFTDFQGNLWQVLAGYFVTGYLLLLVQYFLETIVGIQYATMITQIYLVLSIFIQEICPAGWTRVLFFPGNMIGTHNGSVRQEFSWIGPENTGYSAVMAMEIVLIAALILLSVLRCCKKDIL